MTPTRSRSIVFAFRLSTATSGHAHAAEEEATTDDSAQSFPR